MPFDRFGYAVAATENMIAVGAYQNDDKGTDSGAVYVFQKNSCGESYVQASKLLPSDRAELASGGGFGYAVAMTSNSR
eukprot:m.13923 g.13923  ORF g.13923 m.13923 type:complete len:78 (+) comp10246_c1_seq1:62-295(+)